MELLADRIFQGRAAVTDMGGFHHLRPMDMPKGHIVKLLHHGCIHIVQAAYRKDGLFGIAALRLLPLVGVKLVGQQHVPLAEINPFPAKNLPHCRFIVSNYALRKQVAHIARLEEGEEIEIHLAMHILQHNFFQVFFWMGRGGRG